MFGPVARINTLNNAVVPSVVFNLAEENDLVTVEITVDEVITMCENTTLCTSDFSEKQAKSHIFSAPPNSKTYEIDESYDLKFVTDSISTGIPIKTRQKVGQLVQEFTKFFLKKE